MMDVRTLSARYFRWMLRTACYSYIFYNIITIGLNLIGKDILAYNLYKLIGIPMVISCLFIIVTALLFVLLWKLIAKHSPESITTFFNASSGLRMLLALAVITCYYFVYGQEKITPMALTFIAMYFLQLIVHTTFFTKYLK